MDNYLPHYIIVAALCGYALLNRHVFAAKDASGEGRERRPLMVRSVADGALLAIAIAGILGFLPRFPA